MCERSQGRSDAVAKKPRVCVTSSDRAVCLKKDDHFAKTGSRESRSMAGCGAKPRTSIERRRFYQEKDTVRWAFWIMLVFCGGVWEARARADVPLALGTKPEGASFQLLDGQGKRVLEGKTPFVGKIAAGVYRLVIQRAGFYEEARSLRAESGKPVFLDVELIAQTTPSPPTLGPTPPPLVRGVLLPPTLRAPPTARQPDPARDIPAARRGATDLPSVRTAPTSAPTTSPNPPHLRDRSQEPTSSPTFGAGASQHALKTPPEGSPDAPPNRALPPPVSQPTTQNKMTATTQPAKKTKTPRPIPWVPLAIAAACGIAGGVFFGLSQGSLDAANDRKRTQVDAYSEHLNAQSNRTTAFSLLIAGGAALAVAGLMYSGILKSRSGVSRTSRDDRYAPMTLHPRSQKQLRSQKLRLASKKPPRADAAVASCHANKRSTVCFPPARTPTRLLSMDAAGDRL